MTVVQEDLDLPGGVDPTGVSVKITLWGVRPVGYTPAPASIIGTVTVTPDPDGSWTADLVPNESIVPAGTVYRIQLEGAGVGRAARYISVPDSVDDLLVEDLLVDPPAAPASAALEVHAGLRGPGGHLPDGDPDNGDTILWDETEGEFVYGAGGGGGGGGSVVSVNDVEPDLGGNIDLVAADIPSTATGDVAATNVQSALAELASEKQTAAQVAAAVAALSTVYQPLDGDLTAIAALTTTAFGRALLALADAAAGRTAFGLGTAATSASTDFQPIDSDLTAIAALTTTAYGRAFLALADAAAGRTALGLGTAAVSASSDFQPIDTDLTAIAALTTTSYGRSLLALADAAALRSIAGVIIGTDVEAHDTDLTTIAGLTPTNDDVLQRKAGAWANRTIAQLLTDLAAPGTTFQPLDSDLTAIAALTTTSFGRGLLALADAAALRSSAGLGTAATKDTGTSSGQVPLNSDLNQLIAGNGTTPTPGTGTVQIDLLDQLPAKSIRFSTTGPLLTYARLATTAALPTCTYSNGSLGVGATLTASANGALAAIDLTTPAAGDRIVVKNQASSFQNGLYEVTTLGTAGTPFVLSRCSELDVAAEWLYGVRVFIGEGFAYGGSMLSASPLTIVMGTTAISFVGLKRTSTTPMDVAMGPNRDQNRYWSDFDEFSTAITTDAVRIPGTRFGIFLGGTGATATQASATDLRNGIVDLATGTTTTGYCHVTGGVTAFTFDTAKPFQMNVIAKVATALSDGTNTYLTRIGCYSVTTAAAQTDGIYFVAPADGGNWRAVVQTGGSSATGTDTGIAPVTSGYRTFQIDYDPITGNATFYIGGVLVATISTNLPSGITLFPAVGVAKSAGAVSRSVRVDILDAVVPDNRNVSQLAP